MRVGSVPSEFGLPELAALLRSDQLPVQQEIARNVGVAQSLVSRARSGRLVRMTAKVRALIEYATSVVDAEQIAAAAAASIDAEVPPHKPGHAARASKLSRQAHKDLAAGVSEPAETEDYAKHALRGVEDYLKSGYDPRLIVEQLVVLRRAQQVRRPGRRRLG